MAKGKVGQIYLVAPARSDQKAQNGVADEALAEQHQDAECLGDEEGGDYRRLRPHDVGAPPRAFSHALVMAKQSFDVKARSALVRLLRHPSQQRGPCG